LRRLLESSSDSKQAVAAALRHTADGFVPGLPGLTKLVSLFTKQGKWRKALAIFDVLDNLGLEPDLVITNAALGACARGADTSRLRQLLSDLLGKGHVPDSITYKGAISALSKNGEWEQCVKVHTSDLLAEPCADCTACDAVLHRHVQCSCS
jgi:pentatricopeptide repeat protein